MRLKYRFLIAACLLAVAQAHAADALAQAKLQAVLSCELSVAPNDVVGLIKQLGGKAIVQQSPESDAEYTLPNPVDVYGRPVTHVSLHKGSNGDGDFDEYTSTFSGESLSTIARLADVKPDPAGSYRKAFGNNDLILRNEAGATLITCANGVRSVVKTLKKNAATQKKLYGPQGH